SPAARRPASSTWPTRPTSSCWPPTAPATSPRTSSPAPPAPSWCCPHGGEAPPIPTAAGTRRRRRPAGTPTSHPRSEPTPPPLNPHPVGTMAIRPLPRAAWNDYFDAFSKKKDDTGRVDYAEIRVFSPEDGAQPETRWLPLLGLTYDPKDDLLDVAVEGLDGLGGGPGAICGDEPLGRAARSELGRPDGARVVSEIRQRGPQADCARAFGPGMHEDVRRIAAAVVAVHRSYE